MTCGRPVYRRLPLWCFPWAIVRQVQQLHLMILKASVLKAMNQWAVSIPIVTRALASMLKDNPNPTIQSKLSNLIQGHNQAPNPALSTSSTSNDLKSTIHSALWRTAQTQLQTIVFYQPCAFQIFCARFSSCCCETSRSVSAGEDGWRRNRLPNAMVRGCPATLV